MCINVNRYLSTYISLKHYNWQSVDNLPLDTDVKKVNNLPWWVWVTQLALSCAPKGRCSIPIRTQARIADPIPGRWGAGSSQSIIHSHIYVPLSPSPFLKTNKFFKVQNLTFPYY